MRVETPNATKALAEAHQAYTRDNPRSLKAYNASCQHLPGGNTRTVLHSNPFPLTFASGHESKLTSIDGRTYVDFLGEYTAGIYGHNNSTIRVAINDALDKGWSLGGTSMYEKELAKIVCERFSPTMELVRFTNSGTEANMMALAAALVWTGRKKILVFEKGYHGATISFREPPAGKASKDVNLPHEWIVGTYNDVQTTEKLLSELPRDSLAAIIVEPMLGSGGAIPGDLSFLKFLRSYASSSGALLIFDEVMTSRLSYRGYGHTLGIRPDMMSLGKWVGGGMSFGAFGGRKDIMEMFDPQRGSLAHAGTFNNNIISMAAGCAGCKLLDEETTSRLNDLGGKMKEAVQATIDRVLGSKTQESNGIAHHVSNHLEGHPLNGTSNGVSNGTSKSYSNGIANGITKGLSNGHSHPSTSPQMWISGVGSILAVHFAPSASKAALHSLFYHHMLNEGIYLAERGFMALNIELRSEDVDAFVTATEKFVSKYKPMLSDPDGVQS